jgi:hypothetical protein
MVGQARNHGVGLARRTARRLACLALSLGLAASCVGPLVACSSLGALEPGSPREATLASGITDYTWEAVPAGGGVFTFDAGAGRYTSWRHADEVGSGNADRHDGTYRLLLDEEAASYIEKAFGADGDRALGQLDRLSRAENSEVHYVLLLIDTQSSVIDGVSSKEIRQSIWEGVWFVDQGRLNLTNMASYNEYDFYAEFVPEDERRSPSSRFLENTLDMLEREDREKGLSS